MSERLDRFELRADGRRLIVRRRTGAGPPILLLHALAASWRWWRPTLPHLDPGRELLLPDRPGFGASPGFPLAPAAEARLLAEALEQIGVYRMHVVGHSMGGTVAAELAARYPQRVKSLALIDSAGWPTPYVPRYLGRLARPWSWCRLRFLPVLVTDVVRTRPLRLAVGIRRVTAYDIRPALRELEAPTCIVWGERDRLFLPEQGRAMADLVANARWRPIAGAGHIVPADRPAELASVLEGFWGAA